MVKLLISIEGAPSRAGQTGRCGHIAAGIRLLRVSRGTAQPAVFAKETAVQAMAYKCAGFCCGLLCFTKEYV